MSGDEREWGEEEENCSTHFVCLGLHVAERLAEFGHVDWVARSKSTGQRGSEVRTERRKRESETSTERRPGANGRTLDVHAGRALHLKRPTKPISPPSLLLPHHVLHRARIFLSLQAGSR